MKSLAIAVLSVAALGGCVAVPTYPEAAYYPAPVYYPAPAAGVYVAPPTVYFGGSYRSGGYYGYRGGRHWR